MRLRPPKASLALAILLTIAACDEDNSPDGADASASSDTTTSSKEAPTQPKDAPASTPDQDQDSTRKATSKASATINAQPPLPIERYFKADDVQDLAGDELRSSTLAGQEVSHTYNSLRFSPANRSDKFGAAVQIWQTDSAKSAMGRVASLRDQHLGVRSPNKDAPVRARSAFVAERQNIWHYVFNPKDKAYVVSVSCQRSFCGDEKVVYELGSKVNNRLLAADEPAKAKKPTPTPPKPAPKSPDAPE